MFVAVIVPVFITAGPFAIKEVPVTASLNLIWLPEKVVPVVVPNVRAPLYT